MTKTSNPLGTDPILSLLKKFSVPTALTLMVNYLYNIVDQIFVGQSVGIEGIAATNVAFPFSTICVSVALLIGDGCAANTSLSLGRGEKDYADRGFGNSFLLLILFSLFILIFGNIFLEQLVTLFGATETVFESSMIYSRIILLGLPFMIINVSFTAIIRADGNPKYTMKCMMTGALINVILDPVFIFGFNMGVKGAAIATILGQFVAGFLCLAYIPKFKSITFKKAYMKLSGKVCKTILSLGISSFFTQIATAALQIIMNNLMKIHGAATIYGSDIALSCYGMMMKIYQIAHAMLVGLSSGTQPINGFNYGAKQYDRVKTTYKYAFIFSFIISTGWFIVYMVFPSQIAYLFVNDSPMYQEFAKVCFRSYMLVFFIYGMPMVTSSFFQAIGKPSKALLLSLSRQAFFLIPLSLILSSKFGLKGALFSAPIADTLTFIVALSLIIYEFKLWKKNGFI
ncbi:MATE family efflux transporter [Tyzzerella sp. An114]|uniref:MATE family efflux transporter n=1 Tax=Tyzzerella sp. An114 TaxID=1965545 RepID=UPI000B44B4EE|nr:MATE family efflux transporter [Tyzzerella sp. An114]OUQ59159.1 MATE family efflux transporter [Tyzzerella sp. An114]HIT73472.1 MATE family efflux transporter [Candidatus Fimicola cottocaccae]